MYGTSGWKRGRGGARPGTTARVRRVGSHLVLAACRGGDRPLVSPRDDPHRTCPSGGLRFFFGSASATALYRESLPFSAGRSGHPPKRGVLRARCGSQQPGGAEMRNLGEAVRVPSRGPHAAIRQWRTGDVAPELRWVTGALGVPAAPQRRPARHAARSGIFSDPLNATHCTSHSKCLAMGQKRTRRYCAMDHWWCASAHNRHHSGGRTARQSRGETSGR